MALTGSDTTWPLTTGIGGREAPGVPAQPASPWLTADRAAAYLGYDMANPRKATDALRQLVKRHGLPAYRRGARLLFDRRDLEKWLRARRVA